MSKRRRTAGFSMIELLTVITVLGLMVAMSVPAYRSWANSHALRGAAEGIAGELQNLRARAMATGQSQTVHFNMNYGSYGDYHLHNGSFIGAKWDLPNGVRFSHTGALSMQVNRDGRFTSSSTLVLVDQRDNRDTVSVQLSGLVLVR